jgi:hypothetical protein
MPETTLVTLFVEPDTQVSSMIIRQGTPEASAVLRIGTHISVHGGVEFFYAKAHACLRIAAELADDLEATRLLANGVDSPMNLKLTPAALSVVK